MVDSNIIRWSKSRTTEAKRGSLTFIITSVVSERVIDLPNIKYYAMNLVVLVYQDFIIEEDESKALVWAETCVGDGISLPISNDPETFLTDEFWNSKVDSYIKYFIGKLKDHSIEFLEPRTDPVENAIQGLKILMHIQTKVDPKLH